MFKELFTNSVEVNIEEGLFSKKKDENYDFGESLLFNLSKKVGLTTKGKIVDKSNQFGLKLNLWQFLKDEIDLETNLEIRSFLKKYKYKQNAASLPQAVEGKITVDGEEFIFMAGNNSFKKNTPYIRIFQEDEGY